MQAIGIGIGKRELLQDYYPDELPVILDAYARIHNPDAVKDEQVDVMTFLSM